MTKFVKSIKNSYLKFKAPYVLERAKEQGFPEILVAASRFLIDGKSEPDVLAVRNQVESRRAEISEDERGPVPIYYSPKPGSADRPDRPEPGSLLSFSRKRIAMTGKDPKWGTFLHMLSRRSCAENILELGSCAGLSALYLGSHSFMKSLVTIEAAPALADIARETLRPLGDRATVVTGLFDDALDGLLSPNKVYDFVYIDGHHEKVATIHYFDKVVEFLSAGALVVFDDINWSDDMRSAWDVLRSRKGFAHAVDYGAVGVCIWAGGEVEPAQWDLRTLTNSFSVGKPHGWAYAEGDFVG